MFNNVKSVRFASVTFSREGQMRPCSRLDSAREISPTKTSTNNDRMKLISKSGAKALLLAVCGMSAALATQATTYTWRGTNSTAWTTPGNWLAQSVGPTGAGGIGHRLDVNNQTRNELVYDASLGTTIYGTSGIRGIVIGSGANGSGTFTITGGTFITTNSTAADLVQNTGGNTGILNINGGTFISGSTDFGMGLGAGANTIGFINVNNGSAKMGRFVVNIQQGTFNYNGGTIAFSNMVLTAGSLTNNFNGGTVQARVNHTAFIPNITRANVRDGGAIFDSAGFNITVVAPLVHSVIDGDAAIDGGLTKNGNGTLTLSGLPTYTGPTRVNVGRLAMPLPTTSSSLVVADGARFSPALTNRPWLVASAALTNSTVDFNYVSFSANPDTNAVLYLTDLAISGSVTCNVAGAGFPVTNLTLLSYGSKTGGGSFVLGSLPPGAVATLNDDGANVTLNITSGSVQDLIWSTGDGIWQTNGGFNWNANSAQYLEYPSGVNDQVTFNDTAFGTVNINSQVNPNSTTINVTSSFYTFSGTGSIGGTNGIAKLGTSTLQIDNANNFTGPVTISGGSETVGGTLFVNNPAALGATNGTVTVNGPANTLEIGTPAGTGVAVSNKTVVINGTGVGGARGALRGTQTSSGDNIWAGPVIIGTDLSRIGTEDNGNLTIAGPITDNGANLGVILRPGIGGTVTIASSGSSYAFTRTFGDSSGTGIVKLGATDALSTNRLDLGPGPLNLNGFNQTVGGVVDLAGVGSVVNDGGVASTFTINTGTNIASAFTSAASLVDGSAVLNVVKSGNGTQTFNGPTVTYSGTTTINGGQLNLTSANPMNSAITVAAGGTLGGEGATTSSLTLQANSILAFNPSTATSFTANTIDASASPLRVSLTSTAPPGVPVLVLTAPGGITGSAANFQILGSRGGTFYLTNANTELMFVPAVGASIVWKGNNGVNPTFWDTITTTNWDNSGAPDLFYAGDSVTFDDTASTYTVAITGGTVQPASVTVNAANNYTISGTMGGGGTVTKGGTGTLFFNNNNSYTGTTVITNGILSIQTSGALGSTASGTVISGSGTLDINTTAAFANTINLGAEALTISGSGFGGNGTIVNNSTTANQINAVQQVVMAGDASIGGAFRWDMRGTGNALDMAGFSLTKVGGNQITLVGTTVNNPGGIVVNNGMLSLETSCNLNGSSANTLTVNNGGAVNFYQSSVAPAWTLVLNSGSTFSATSGNGAQNHWIGPVTLNGAATLNSDGGHIYVDGEISGVGSIVKIGTSGATLSVSNSYTGNTTVNAGTLNLGVASLASGSTVTVANGAVLSLNFVETNTVAALVLNGVSQPAGEYSAASSSPFLAGTGLLKVAPSAPPTMSLTNTGGSLVITFAGGTLQVQTNSLSTGISTNWVNYPGTSPATFPIDAANGSVFFRVKQ